MPRPLAWRTIESIAWSASEMPASCRFSRSLAPCISSTTSGWSADSTEPKRPRSSFAKWPGGALVHHRDRLIRVASAQHRQQLRRVRAWLVDHQQRRRGRDRAGGQAVSEGHELRPDEAAAQAETLTPNVQLALWPRASVAVQVTVVVPSANVPPDAGAAGRVDRGFTALPDRGVVGHRRRRAVVRDRLHRRGAREAWRTRGHRGGAAGVAAARREGHGADRRQAERRDACRDAPYRVTHAMLGAADRSRVQRTGIACDPRLGAKPEGRKNCT